MVKPDQFFEWGSKICIEYVEVSKQANQIFHILEITYSDLLILDVSEINMLNVQSTFVLERKKIGGKLYQNVIYFGKAIDLPKDLLSILVYQ